MKSQYNVVNTTPNDLEMICWMFEEAIAYQKRNNYKGWGSYDKAFLENEISKKLQYKIVENENILCIFSVCYIDPLIWREKDKGTSIYLHRITVNPKFKGQKQFEKVLNWAIEYAYKNQLDTIRMDTWAENTTIIDYYKSYGFQFLENYKTANTKELPFQHRNLNVALLEYKVKPMIFDNYELRLLQRDDKKYFFQLIKDNLARLEDFVAGIVAQTKTENDVKNFINNSIIKIQDKTYYPYLIIDLKTKMPIGFVDIKNIDWSIPKAELGFFIDENYSGKGISTKAIIHLSGYLFKELKFNKLLLRIHQSNKSSIGVAEKCGFELEGIVKNDYKTTKGEIVDFRYYGKIKFKS